MSATLNQPANPAPLLPPEESTWRRYSAHNEGEMSWATSAVVHIFVLGILVALGILYKFEHKKPPTNEEGLTNIFRAHRQAIARPVVMEGGNANNLGKDKPDGPGGVAPQGDTPRPEVGAPTKPNESLVDKTLTQLNPIDVQKLAQQLPEGVKETEAGKRFLQTGHADDSIKIFAQLNEKVVTDLNRGLQQPVGTASQQGTPNGEPGGDPTRGGDPNGGGGAGGGRTLNERQKRMYRWKLDFDLPHNVSEAQRIDLYLHQLDGLGAILALPTDRANTQFLVIRKLLDRPARPVREDPARLGLIYWYETNPAMGQALARHMGVAIPNGYIILMPQSLESTMEKLEQAKAPGVRSDDIVETRFKVIAGGGRFTVECLDVRTK